MAATMTYTQYREQRQKEYNALPVFYAFSDDQLEKEMNKRGLTIEDTDKIYKLGNSGGFYLRSDADIIRDFFNKPDLLPELMEDEAFAESAFRYEMGNHEYHINWEGDYNVCACFGSCEYGEDKTYKDYLKEMGYSQTVVNAFGSARRKFLKECEENDWY